MLATQIVIDTLAGRIERAYRLRRPSWHGGCSTARVWAVAAGNLLRAHEVDPSVPIDPELFVAAQPADSPYADPWAELTQPEAARWYRKRIRQIVRGLRDELTEEVRQAEERLRSGHGIARLLAAPSRWLSPMGRFIVAHRAGRAALAERFRDAASEQHRSCPLYRQAIADMLPDDLYPVPTTPAPPPPVKAPAVPVTHGLRGRQGLN